MSFDMLMLLLPAFTACLVLTGIHVYLGLHVIARGVIFVDLALAQVAALGATVAMLYGAEPGSVTAYFVSLGFTVVGALLFTGARSQSKRVPIEAFIGIVYAVCSALAVIVADRLPHGADEIHEILVGNLLSVSWEHIAATVGIYLFVGAVHLTFRKQFLTLSLHPETAQQELNVPLWDLLFYLSFGMVITSSVAMGGVLIVFCYLVIPTVIAALFLSRTLPRLLAGWAIGFVGSVLGITASVSFDLPTGAAVVAMFGVLLAVALLARVLKPGEVAPVLADADPTDEVPLAAS